MNEREMDICLKPIKEHRKEHPINPQGYDSDIVDLLLSFIDSLRIEKVDLKKDWRR